ncbi:MAG: T9SS type A sorting domain-containing protein [Candidatus Cloacimonetes bacterium]|nr:T9SS type A sorting domain-containing protein [Candidatus Cloacimonadota bacterium]
MTLFCLTIAYATNYLDESGDYILNGISLNLEPKVSILENPQWYRDLIFEQSHEIHADKVVHSYHNPAMDIHITLSEKEGFFAKAKQVEISAEYHENISIVDFRLVPSFTNTSPKMVLRGAPAIQAQDPAQNKNLYSFTDRIIQYKFEDRSLWFAASGFEGCTNAEWLAEDAIYLYHHSLHFARRYDQVAMHFGIRTDALKRKANDSDYHSFLIFEEEPIVLDIMRWPAGKQAALVITNDADGEGPACLSAVFFGSSNVNSPKYLKQGIIANNIKMTNTVFGVHKPVMQDLWRALDNNGVKIGYHTASPYEDLTDVTYQNLIYDMDEFDIRSWIDHSWARNPECFCVEGWDPDSPYYIMDAINDSKIDYVWLGDASFTNPMNSFTEPWRLPHKLSEFDELQRDVWFYGRTLMSTWEAQNYYYLHDFKTMMTPENLDQLLNEQGLCVVYTHFFYAEVEPFLPFYQSMPDGSMEIRAETEERLKMLDYYQNNRGLWIDTLEEVFDRMIATEEIKIQGVMRDAKSDSYQVKLTNGSDYPLTDIALTYRNENIVIPTLSANSSEVLSLARPFENPNEQDHYLDLRAKYKDGAIRFMHKQDEPLPKLKIDIYNLRGQKVSSKSFAEGSINFSIPFANRASGVYFARIELAGGYKKTIKLLVLK